MILKETSRFRVLAVATGTGVRSVGPIWGIPPAPLPGGTKWDNPKLRDQTSAWMIKIVTLLGVTIQGTARRTERMAKSVRPGFSEPVPVIGCPSGNPFRMIRWEAAKTIMAHGKKSKIPMKAGYMTAVYTITIQSECSVGEVSMQVF